MSTPYPPDLAEVERMVEAGAVDPNASHRALLYMASRFIAEEVRKRERSAARANESAAAVHRAQASAEVLKRAQQIASSVAAKAHTDWALLLDSTFALPSGERVTFAAATAEQHELRAVALEAMAAGDLQTAGLHREAISVIERAGVDTLGDALALEAEQ